MLIDSHAHLAGDRFDADRSDVQRRAWEAGVTHIVVIGDATTAARDLARTDSGRLSFTAGVHPHEAHAFDAAIHLPLLRALVTDGAVAIGECGLDYHYDHSPRERQRVVFQQQIQLARDCGLPLVVHTREAEADTTEMIMSAAADGVAGILHCFTGSLELAQTAIGIGWYISFSGIATFRTWEHDDVVALVPENQLLVETDAPYLAPVPHRGRRNEPAFLPSTVEHVARVRGVSAAALAAQTARNAIRCFRLPVALLPA